MITYQIVLIDEETKDFKPIEHFKTGDVKELEKKLIKLQKKLCLIDEKPVIKKKPYKSSMFYIECLVAISKSKSRYAAPLRTITKKEALSNY